MTKKKFLSISLVSALLAGVFVFYSCKKDDDPATKGRKAAQELCDCLEKAENEQAGEACFSTFESKYAKYENDSAFEDAFNEAIEDCEFFLMDLAELGLYAAQELCDCFANAADQLAEMACMMGLMTKYAGLFRDMSTMEGGEPEFEEAFSAGFMGGCTTIPDWFICAWAPELCAGGE